MRTLVFLFTAQGPLRLLPALSWALDFSTEPQPHGRREPQVSLAPMLTAAQMSVASVHSCQLPWAEIGVRDSFMTNVTDKLSCYLLVKLYALWTECAPSFPGPVEQSQNWPYTGHNKNSSKFQTVEVAQATVPARCSATRSKSKRAKSIHGNSETVQLNFEHYPRKSKLTSQYFNIVVIRSLCSSPIGSRRNWN